MRLIGAVKRLEGAAAARRVAPASIGIAWTKNEKRVTAEDLAEGEYVAVDVTVSESPAGAAAWWSVAERVTCDVGDLGYFYQESAGSDPVRIGRVVSIDTDMVRYRLDEEPYVDRELLRSSPTEE